LAANALSSTARHHSKKVKVRVVVSVAHDREAGDAPANAGYEHVDTGCTNARLYPRRRPAPLQTVFN